MILQEGMDVANRFRLVRMIGKGGMGSVWEAHDTALDTKVAVKFIEGELAGLAEAHQRFQREARAAAQLKSPHVVQILDHGAWQGMPYIAMELLEGRDLGKYMQAEGGKLHAPEVNRIMQQVCKALTKAHQAGIVHRDLKPDNIFLVNDDDAGFVVKILDFGVAKSAAHAIDGSNTKTGAMLGTPYYMSPEQAQGIKTVDARSDLWSLAVIVFQCLTGRLPFESEALGDLLVKIIVAPIPMPSIYEPNLPPTIDEWWLKAADRNPENRYPTAKAFADSLALRLGQSSVTDIIDRNKLLKLGAGTAMMAQAPGVGQNVPNTPFPDQSQQQQHAMAQQQAAMAQTPNPYSQQTPPGMQLSSSGTGATFSGVEPPVMLPKKGPPVALLVGVAALAMIGLALGGFALLRGKAATHAAGDPASSSSVAAAGGDTPGGHLPTEGATPPSAVASASAAPSTPSTPDAPEPVASAAPSATVAAVRPGSGKSAPVVVAQPKPATPVVAAAPASSAKPAAAPAAGTPAAAKPGGYNPGF